MANVIYSPLVADMRGPIGATVFKRTRTGPVAQRRARGRKISTPAQTTIRATVARLAAVWRSLEPGARAKWIRYAATLRNTFRPERLPGLANPYNLFIAYNAPSVALGAGVAEAPPSSVGFNPPMRLTTTFYSLTLIGLNFNIDPLYSGDTCLVYFSRPFRRSQTNPRTWTSQTTRFVGPLSTPQNVTLTRACGFGMDIRVSAVRHSITRLDAIPQIIRTGW